MDTSRKYYETVMRDYSTYGCGRSLERYCRDEGIDYKWVLKAQELYGIQEKKKSTRPVVRKSKQKAPDMINLHFEPESEEESSDGQLAETTEFEGAEEEVSGDEAQWKVSSLKVITPLGYEIEISTSNPSAVNELLTKLTA